MARGCWVGLGHLDVGVDLVDAWLDTGRPTAALREHGREGDLMRCLVILSLLVVAGCAVPEPYGGTSAPSSVPSNLSTMRQITGRADGLETLRPEPGDIWATERSSEPPPTPPRSLRTTAPKREVLITPPPLSHAEGDFWRMP